MLKSTKDAVAAICKADPSITAEQLKAALAELAGEGHREVCGTPPPERAYSRDQVAAMLGCTKKSVSNFKRLGLLTPIYLGAGRQRATAFTGESVRALLEGRRSA